MKSTRIDIRRIITILVIVAALTTVVWTIVQSNPSFEHSGPSKIEVGAVAPDFVATNMEGQQVRLSEYRGKVVLINFWASWCIPCIREMPLIHSVFQSQDKDVETLFINVGDTKGTVNEFMNDQQFTFPVIIDITGKVSGLYGITGLPATFIIDKSGTFNRVIVGEVTDNASLRGWLEDAKYSR
ncbi:redoxin domain-containing protein [Paenibacillus sp. FA6]|uniref:redoxin domain-containing protein n=1 Tax=Paenibacillus sp. FA6 TaxID=3413029 RepID=UPI003F655FBD